MQPITPVDITGDDHQHSLSSILGVTQCKWFQVSGISVSRGNVGDSTIEANGGGFPISTGTSFQTPSIALAMSFYNLDEWFVMFSNGDIASVGCAI